MSEMVEKVARAIAFEMNPFSSTVPDEDHFQMARAAIEALRNPTEEMILAGVGEAGRPAPYNQMKFGYQAMIDTALKESETEQ